MASFLEGLRTYPQISCCRMFISARVCNAPPFHILWRKGFIFLYKQVGSNVCKKVDFYGFFCHSYRTELFVFHNRDKRGSFFKRAVKKIPVQVFLFFFAHVYNVCTASFYKTRSLYFSVVADGGEWSVGLQRARTGFSQHRVCRERESTTLKLSIAEREGDTNKTRYRMFCIGNRAETSGRGLDRREDLRDSCTTVVSMSLVSKC